MWVFTRQKWSNRGRVGFSVFWSLTHSDDSLFDLKGPFWFRCSSSVTQCLLTEILFFNYLLICSIVKCIWFFQHHKMCYYGLYETTHKQWVEIFVQLAILILIHYFCLIAPIWAANRITTDTAISHFVNEGRVPVINFGFGLVWPEMKEQ